VLDEANAEPFVERIGLRYIDLIVPCEPRFLDGTLG
jgi:hypothetical protein